ncbi:MAG: plastocyanin/azurin family copper-binding protein [Thermomicrobiales bacterium]
MREPVPAGATEIRIVTDDADGFQPSSITVDLGATLAFVNTHHDEHTASGPGFDSGVIGPGSVVTIVVDSAGAFPYACRFHPEMTGEVRVRDASGAVPVAGSASVATTAVVIASLAYTPARIAVTPGQTVTWSNEDSVPHTVTADDGLFDSGILDPGGVFEWTFTEAQSVAYSCLVHPSMHGFVDVGGSASQAPLAATPGPRQAPDGEHAGIWSIVLSGADSDAGVQLLLHLENGGAAQASLAPLEPGGETYAGSALGQWTQAADTITVDLVALRTGPDGVLSGTMQLMLELQTALDGQASGVWRRNDGSTGTAIGARVTFSPPT